MPTTPQQKPASTTGAVTASGIYRGTINSAAVTVVASDETAPDAPTMESNTADSITLIEISGYQYGIVTDNGIKWQTTTTFTGLDRNTTYSFVQRSGTDGAVSAGGVLHHAVR